MRNLNSLKGLVEYLAKECAASGITIHTSIFRSPSVDGIEIVLYNPKTEQFLRKLIDHKTLLDQTETTKIIMEMFNKYPFNKPSKLERALK